MNRRDSLKSALRPAAHSPDVDSEMNLPATLLFPERHLPEPTWPIRQRSLLSPPAIRAQLWKILKSKGFVHAERMRRFLRFVVEEALAGRANQLCEYAVGISVFERDESFSPALDPIVRNEARRLRQKLLEYYHQSPCERDDQIIIDVPKGGYFPLFRAASHREAASTQGNYRLVASLTRIVDGTQVWNTERDLQINDKSQQPCVCISVSGQTLTTRRLDQRNYQLPSGNPPRCSTIG